MIVATSYLFYGWWDARFLTLIISSTLLDYWIGRRMGKEEEQQSRKLLLACSVFVNLAFLGFFKYFDFFIENFLAAFSLFGIEWQVGSLGIILPVGISFYTFQTLSYSIDVYRRKIEPTNDLLSFSAFVGFFPQLVAGPIEKAKNLLPQFQHVRTFTYEIGMEGLIQVIWGFFKKILVADLLAPIVNEIFFNYSELNGGILLIGLILFGFQIYADFSGYSDIAIGLGKLFGVHLSTNFAYPFFAFSFAQFWRTWHITLMEWFRAYVYIPLGGNRKGRLKLFRNILVVFALSGLWHGANFTYILWGLMHGTFIVIWHLTFTRWIEGNPNSWLLKGLSFLLTYAGVTLLWAFFRSPDLNSTFLYLDRIFNDIFSPESLISTMIWFKIKYLSPFAFCALMLLVDWLGKKNSFPLKGLSTKSMSSQIVGISFLVILILLNVSMEKSEFIYFQF